VAGRARGGDRLKRGGSKSITGGMSDRGWRAVGEPRCGGGVKERKKIDRRVRKTPTLLRLIRQAARKRTEAAVHARRRRRRSLVGLPPRPRSFATVHYSRCCRIVRACLFDPPPRKKNFTINSH